MTGHFPGTSLPELFILRDSTGYVTACHPTHRALEIEVGRRPLLAPITVYHWATGRSADSLHTIHVLKDAYQWP